jgi:hypothetical protein
MVAKGWQARNLGLRLYFSVRKPMPRWNALPFCHATRGIRFRPGTLPQGPDAFALTYGDRAGKNLRMRCAVRNSAPGPCLAFRKTREIVPYPGFQCGLRLEMRNIPTQATHETPFATDSSVMRSTFNSSCRGLFVIANSYYPRSMSRMTGDSHAPSRKPVHPAAG